MSTRGRSWKKSSPIGWDNLHYSNTRQMVGAFEGAMAGTKRGRIVVGADSGGAGTGALNNDTIGARAKSWPVLLAQAIRAMGGNAYSNWAIGSGLAGATLATFQAYDPRVVFGSAASLSSTITSCAGQSWGTGADSTNGYFEVTPGEAFDTVDVLHGTASLLGIFQMFDQALVQAGGNTDTSGANGVAEHSFVFPAGSTKARLKSTGTNVRIAGMGFRKASEPGMEVINMSISGAGSDFYATEANNPSGNGWMNHNASMPIVFTGNTFNGYILSAGANDINAGASLDTVKARARSRIQQLKALAHPPDIWVYGYPPASPAAYTQAAREALNEALRSVAVDEFDLPFLNPLRYLPSHLEMQAIGLGATDGRHLQAAGQRLQMVAPLIAAMEYAAGLAY